MKILPRKTSLACLLALVALAPSGFSQRNDADLWLMEDKWLIDLMPPFGCQWLGGGRQVCNVWGPSWRKQKMLSAPDSCGNENLFLIDVNKGTLIAQHVLEPGEELEEVVNVTPTEVTVIVNNDNTDTLLAQFQTYLSQNPTWGQLAPGAIEAQVVTPSSHFPDLLFGTPSRAAAFDRWYDEVYKVSSTSTESSEMLRTYRIDKAEKRLLKTQESIFKQSDPEQLVDDGIAAASDSNSSSYYTFEVSADGATLKVRSYAPKRTATRLGL